MNLFWLDPEPNKQKAFSNQLAPGNLAVKHEVVSEGLKLWRRTAWRPQLHSDCFFIPFPRWKKKIEKERGGGQEEMRERSKGLVWPWKCSSREFLVISFLDPRILDS